MTNGLAFALILLSGLSNQTVASARSLRSGKIDVSFLLGPTQYVEYNSYAHCLHQEIDHRGGDRDGNNGGIDRRGRHNGPFPPPAPAPLLPVPAPPAPAPPSLVPAFPTPAPSSPATPVQPILPPPPPPSPQGTAPTRAQVTAIEADIISTFRLRPTYGELCSPCAEGDTIGVLLRMAFHDAVGGGGGSNGCIDFTAPDNNGLRRKQTPLAS